MTIKLSEILGTSIKNQYFKAGTKLAIRHKVVSDNLPIALGFDSTYKSLLHKTAELEKKYAASCPELNEFFQPVNFIEIGNTYGKSLIPDVISAISEKMVSTSDLNLYTNEHLLIIYKFYEAQNKRFLETNK